MRNTGRGAGRGRGRAGPPRGGLSSVRGSPEPHGSPEAGRGRGLGGTPQSFRGGGDRGARGSVIRGSLLPVRGRGRGVFLSGQPAEIDLRIANSSDKALVSSFDSERGSNDLHDLPLRPDFGTEGREIKLRTNFFPVQIPTTQQGQDCKLYTYHVHISPANGAATYRMRKRIYDLAERTTEWGQAGMIGRVVHDNDTRLFSPFLLPQPLTIKVPYTNEEEVPPSQVNRTLTLMIVFVQEFDTAQLASYLVGQFQSRNYDTSPVIAALTLILTSLPRKTGVIVGRNQYFSPQVAEPFRVGGGVEAWKGIRAFVRPVYKQVMINVDVRTSAFYTPGNMAFAMMALNGAPVVRMNRLFRGIRIETTYLGYRRVVACKGFVSNTARTQSLNTPEYGLVTVEEYFRRKYNIRLQHPDLQLVEVAGQTESYFPAELCSILPGQPFYRGLPSEQTIAMTVASCRPPKVHGDATITQFRHQFRVDTIGPELEGFGITVGRDMAVIPGRILSKPSITYASSVAPTPVRDQATWNLLGVRFAVGARLDNWAVLVIKGGAPRAEFAGASDVDLRMVVSDFRQMCNTSGMQVNAEPTYATVQLPRENSASFDPMRQEAIKAIKDTLLTIRPKPTLVLVMLANGDAAIYDGLKHLCDVHLDVATVCVQSAKIRRRTPHYLANVALKVNAKLGGINHRLDTNGAGWLYDALTMVVGMDVSHPSPGSAVGCPSIAAVVASVGNDFAQYPATLEFQNSGLELITTLKNMMIDRLRLFQKKNYGWLPERILIYRGGLSQSQFKFVREIERPQIIEAFEAFDSAVPYRPKIAIVICSKSRHVRFYPTEQNDATQNGNPLPGTVVDRGITAIYDFDFYLQSHGSGALQARPTHYYVIDNEVGYTADEIQGITNALSYMFSRATQAISLPSPVYYADAACRRGRCYLRKLFYGCMDDEVGTTVSGTQGGSEGGTTTERVDVMEEARRLWGWGVAGAGLRDTMFYL